MAALDACQHCLPEELQTAAKALVDSFQSDLNNSFVDELRHFAMFADICKEEEPYTS